jgi:hypothetical protein
VNPQLNRKKTKDHWKTFFFPDLQTKHLNSPANKQKPAHPTLQLANQVLAFFFWITSLLTWPINPRDLLDVNHNASPASLPSLTHSNDYQKWRVTEIRQITVSRIKKSSQKKQINNRKTDKMKTS